MALGGCCEPGMGWPQLGLDSTGNGSTIADLTGGPSIGARRCDVAAVAAGELLADPQPRCR